MITSIHVYITVNRDKILIGTPNNILKHLMNSNLQDKENVKCLNCIAARRSHNIQQ